MIFYDVCVTPFCIIFISHSYDKWKRNKSVEQSMGLQFENRRLNAHKGDLGGNKVILSKNVRRRLDFKNVQRNDET